MPPSPKIQLWKVGDNVRKNVKLSVFLPQVTQIWLTQPVPVRFSTMPTLALFLA